MKKILVLFVLSVFINTVADAQPHEVWEKIIPNLPGWCEGSNLLRTPDGSFLICAYDQPSTEKTGHVYRFRDSVQLWEYHRHLESHMGRHNAANAIGGGYVVSMGDTMFKFNESGAVVTTEYILHGSFSYNHPFNVVCDGRYYYVGWDTYQNSRMNVFDSTLAWYLNIIIEEGIQDMLIDDSYLYLLREGGSDTAHVTKMNKFSLQVIWDRSFPKIWDGQLALAEDGLYYVGMQRVNYDFSDGWRLYKLDADGNISWTYARPEPDPSAYSYERQIRSYGVTSMPGGSCIVVGASVDSSEGYPQPVASLTACRDGNLLWEYIPDSTFWRRFFAASWDNDGYLIAIQGQQYNGDFSLHKLSIPGITAVNGQIEAPQSFALAQNYPNPFNPVTTISFSLPVSSNTTLKVYDLLGQEVATLINGEMTAGTHETQFAAAGLASGVYLYQLDTGTQSLTRKMLIMK